MISLFQHIREVRLSAKNVEGFYEALVCQYRDLINEAILESETHHKTRLDIGKLNSKLHVICKAAQYDGLDENTINDLIDMAIPSCSENSHAA